EGCRPSSPLTFLSWAVGSFRVGRSFAYSGSLKGTTVLRPSLPPVSSTTTRMVSLAPLLPAGPAARAVRPRKVGTVSPQPTSPAEARVDLRKSRRSVVTEGSSNRVGRWRPGLIELELREGQDEVAQGPHGVVGGVLGRPVDGGLPGAGLPEVAEQPGPRLLGDVPLEEQPQEE